jgi:hypothetical protein
MGAVYSISSSAIRARKYFHGSAPSAPFVPSDYDFVQPQPIFGSFVICTYKASGCKFHRARHFPEGRTGQW